MTYKKYTLTISIFVFIVLAAEASAPPDLGDFLRLNGKKQRDQFELKNAEELASMRTQPNKFSKSQKLKILTGAGDIMYFHAIAGNFTLAECERGLST